MVSAMLLTGAMHEDGFADSCDGFGGGWTREQVLRIMHDPRLGTYGVVGIVMLLALKFAVLNNLRPVQVPFVLVAAHAASRFVAVSLVHSHPYVRPEGTGKSHAVVQSTSRVDLLVAALFGLLPMVFFPTNQALLILAGLLAARITAGRYLTRRLGGYTGDCLGAVQQFSEVVFYLTALATA
jgi:adenosylcobinamide-GDP ribazoletransferase